jgi:Ca2+-binding EF-hand superfamily protein
MASPRRTTVNIEDLLGSLDQMKSEAGSAGSVGTRTQPFPAPAERGLNSASSMNFSTDTNYISSSEHSDRFGNNRSSFSAASASRPPISRPGSAQNINLTQIQDALRGVSASPQIYHDLSGVNRSNARTRTGPTFKEPPTTATVAHNAVRDPATAAGISMAAYEALVKLANMPQRKHYTGPVSASPSQRYQHDAGNSDDLLYNQAISVFDVARYNPKDPTPQSSMFGVLSQAEGAYYDDNNGSLGSRGKRFESSQLNSHSHKHGAGSVLGRRALSAPPRTTIAKPLSSSLKYKKDKPLDDNSTVTSNGIRSMGRDSLYNAICNPKPVRNTPSAETDNDSFGSGKLRPTTKGFRGCSVPDGPNAGRVDPVAATGAETEIISQMKGTAGNLRKTLQRADMSRSGKLNFDDFRLGLKKGGIHLSDEKASALFFNHAESVGNKHGYYGYTGGKALDIENFVLRIANKSSAPLYSHVHNGNSGKSVKDAEEMRVLRKVVHATNKQADPMLVFRTLEPRQKRYLTPQQFREGLMHIGAPLNDGEFNVLMDRVDTNHDGRIDVGELQTLLNRSVKEVDHAALSQRQQHLHAHDRYTPTYRSNVMNICNTTSEFGHVRDSAVVRREDYRWSKLKSQLQREKDSVLKAFCASYRHGDRGKRHSTVGYAVQPLTVPQLRSKLAQEGVHLCEDDAERLQVHVERALGDDRLALGQFGDGNPVYSTNEENKNTISLDSFCAIVGIPRAVTKDNRTGI